MNKYRRKVSFKILLLVEYTQLKKVEFVVDTDLEEIRGNIIKSCSV